VGQLARDTAGQVFWQRIIGKYTGGAFEQVMIKDYPDEPPYPGQNFDNTERVTGESSV
jgi:hypothetical protein